MTAVDVLGRASVRDGIDRLAHEVAAEFDPDVSGASTEAYLLEVRSDVSEAVVEALGNTLGDVPAFSDWCAERDLLQGCEGDR